MGMKVAVMQFLPENTVVIVQDTLYLPQNLLNLFVRYSCANLSVEETEKLDKIKVLTLFDLSSILGTTKSEPKKLEDYMKDEEGKFYVNLKSKLK